MNKIMTKAVLLAAAFIVLIPLSLAAQDEGYYPYSYARLSYVNGAVFVQRTADLGYEKGEVNLALVQGDKIGTESGRAEIQLGRRNYLRLDENTKVEFAVLPTSDGQRISLHLTEGRIYVRVTALPTDKGVEIHTPDASFYVLEEGLYRLDVRPEGDTQVLVREGSLEAATEDGSVLVEAQKTVTAAAGRLVGEPDYGYASNDAFDDWSGSRDQLQAARSGQQNLPTGMEEYEEELDQNGHWVYERPYGNVWVPDVSYYDDWRPYYYGRWGWYPSIGWTWIPSESWGWSVYHYGRWNWRFGLGWYWIPTSHWGPAWVNWWWDGDYVGWCPLTWYNRPGYLFNDRFYDRWDNRWFSAHNRAMTVVRRGHLQDPDVGRRHLGSADLDRIGRVDLRAQQPGIRPRVDNGGPQAIAARRALADRPGVRNQVRDVAPSRGVASSRLRPAGADQGLRSRDRGVSPSAGGRDAVARPSIRGDGGTGRAIRSYPSGRTASGRDQGGVSTDRRSVAGNPSRRNDGAVRSDEARGNRSQGQDRGASRGATVREQPSRTGTSGAERGEKARTGGEKAKTGGETVKKDPSTNRSIRSSDSGSGRSQSRTYPSRSSVSRPSSRLSSPSVSSARPSPSISRPSVSGRSSDSFGSRSGSSRNPSYAQPRSSYGSSSRSRSGSPSYASPRSSSSGRTYSAPRSSSSSGRSYSAPRSSSSGRTYGAPRSSGSSGRSYSAPRSSGSSGRSYSAPRSSGSSGRSYSAPRSSGSSGRSGGSSGRSSSSGRSGSSSSRSSGSSSRSSSGHKR